jgi:hypothetical protein
LAAYTNTLDPLFTPVYEQHYKGQILTVPQVLAVIEQHGIGDQFRARHPDIAVEDIVDLVNGIRAPDQHAHQITRVLRTYKASAAAPANGDPPPPPPKTPAPPAPLRPGPGSIARGGSSQQVPTELELFDRATIEDVLDNFTEERWQKVLKEAQETDAP